MLVAWSISPSKVGSSSSRSPTAVRIPRVPRSNDPPIPCTQNEGKPMQPDSCNQCKKIVVPSELDSNSMSFLVSLMDLLVLLEAEMAPDASPSNAQRQTVCHWQAKRVGQRMGNKNKKISLRDSAIGAVDSDPSFEPPDITTIGTIVRLFEGYPRSKHGLWTKSIAGETYTHSEAQNSSINPTLDRRGHLTWSMIIIHNWS